MTRGELIYSIGSDWECRTVCVVLCAKINEKRVGTQGVSLRRDGRYKQWERHLERISSVK